MNTSQDSDHTQTFIPLNDGTMVNQFRLVRRIGSGGMGEVYLADDQTLDRLVALKFMPAQYCSDADLKNRFLREAKAAAKLNHPNIVTVYGVGEFNGRPYFAMEFVEGKSLHVQAHEAPLAITRIIEFGIQVGEGLRKAHEQGIIHRDIKTANIIVGNDGRARILDFGLAAVRDGEKLTRDGSTLGTVAYMSPEQVRGMTVDQRSDLFSLGVVLYELIAGRTPFRRENDAATMNAISSDTPEPLLRYKVGVPTALQQVIDKLLQKDPSVRYQSSADLIADLKRAQMDISSPSTSAITPSRPMVAVLPFDNHGSAEREYFADGITEEVVARLARLKEIGVIAQSSAAQYKKSPKRLREIGQELACGYLLQGSIRWDEAAQPARVRISAKLTSVHDETYLWAETYDRILDQIFAVQSDIAAEVSKALGVTLMASRQSPASSGGTANLDAYDLYLRAREHFPGTIEPAMIREAAKLLRKAIDLDPSYAVARAHLARTEVALYWMTDKARAHLSEAKTQIDRALELSPDLFEAHVALGYYHYWGQLDYDHALEQFGKAMSLRPNDAEVMFSISMVERRQGKFMESAERLDLAIRLSPRNQLALINQAHTLLLLRRYDDALAMIDRALQIRPEIPIAWEFKAIVASCRAGDFSAGAEVLKEATRFVPLGSQIGDYPSIMIYLAYHDNDPAKALDSLDLYLGTLECLPFLNVRLALAHMAGRKDMARAYAEAVVITAEAQLEREPEDYQAIEILAVAYALLGRHDRARELAVRLLSTRAFCTDAINRIECLAYLVSIYAQIGDLDTGISFLEKLLSGPTGFVSAALIPKFPLITPLKAHPRFSEIIAK